MNDLVVGIDVQAIGLDTSVEDFLAFAKKFPDDPSRFYINWTTWDKVIKRTVARPKQPYYRQNQRW